jgi:hypothetical protein
MFWKYFPHQEPFDKTVGITLVKERNLKTILEMGILSNELILC